LGFPKKKRAWQDSNLRHTAPETFWLFLAVIRNITEAIREALRGGF
jgi:hypothetical protein